MKKTILKSTWFFFGAHSVGWVLDNGEEHSYWHAIMCSTEHVLCTLCIFTAFFSLVAAKQVPAKKAESSSEDSDDSSDDDDEEESPKPAAKKVAAPTPASQKRKHKESSDDEDEEEEDAKPKSVSVWEWV